MDGPGDEAPWGVCIYPSVSEALGEGIGMAFVARAKFFRIDAKVWEKVGAFGREQFEVEGDECG